LLDVDDTEYIDESSLVKNFTRWSSKEIDPRSNAAFSEAIELIGPDLYSVEERIHEQSKAVDAGIEHYFEYAIGGSGKRLRPALALLAGGATGRIVSDHVDLAVIVELIHIASLVHDDIMDGADRRRDRPTLNAKWGNSLTVLVGDVLFAHALRLSTKFSNSDISRRIADAAADVCTGEILQTQRRFDLNIPLSEYYRMVQMKTGALFAVSCELGAFLSGASPSVISALKNYGNKIGIAYQVLDDCIDLVGDEEMIGKTLGTDIACGKFTLPVLLLLQNSSPKDRDELQSMLLSEEGISPSRLVELVTSRGALPAAVKAARSLVDEADAELEKVQENRHAAALHSMTEYLRGVLDSLC
jgi:octaprenyl-diphosphate synthase